MNRLKPTKQAQVIAVLVEGTSVNATSRIAGVAKHIRFSTSLKNWDAPSLSTTIDLSAT